LILYQTEDGRARLEVRFEGDTAWLTQLQMAELFQTSVPNVNMHLLKTTRRNDPGGKRFFGIDQED
jgi:hypothetical protein